MELLHFKKCFAEILPRIEAFFDLASNANAGRNPSASMRSGLLEPAFLRRSELLERRDADLCAPVGKSWCEFWLHSPHDRPMVLVRNPHTIDIEEGKWNKMLKNAF